MHRAHRAASSPATRTKSSYLSALYTVHALMLEGKGYALLKIHSIPSYELFVPKPYKHFMGHCYIATTPAVSIPAISSKMLAKPDQVLLETLLSTITN